MDVEAAFLQGEIDEPTWIEEPQIIFEKEIKEGKVEILNSRLYGLRQAPLLWNETKANYLKQKGYKRNSLDTYLFSKYTDDKLLVVLAIYVDDILIISKKIKTIIQIKKE
jgi:Reverse transcriptase (RNA-dependent DNA polymerase)